MSKQILVQCTNFSLYTGQTSSTLELLSIPAAIERIHVEREWNIGYPAGDKILHRDEEKTHEQQEPMGRLTNAASG